MEILVNRAPFLTLWASVVARRLGYDEEAALTLGRAVAGQTAAAKGKRLGLLQPRPAEERQRLDERREELGAHAVVLMDRVIACVQTAGGLRALSDARPTDPEGVRRYLAAKFGDALRPVEEKLLAVAGRFSPEDLSEHAMDLYMEMRPTVASGAAGWGQAGRLDLGTMDRILARRNSHGEDAGAIPLD